jgi:hypothetical protein
MKKVILLNIFLSTVIKLFGQYDFPRFDFSSVTGVDSITVESTSDNSVWKEVFYYKNNRRIRTNSFDNEGLFNYRIFAYNDKKEMNYEFYYGKSSKFNSEKDDWIEFWDSSSCSLIIKSLSNDKVIQEMNGGISGADTTINQITIYAYDSDKRLSKEQTRDVFVGLVGSFKSNSVELNHLGEKNEVTTYSKLFEYSPRKIVVLYKVNDSIRGKEIIELNDKHQPNSHRQYDHKNNLIYEISAKYDEENRLNSLTWKSYSSMTIWGQEGDVVSE